MLRRISKYIAASLIFVLLTGCGQESDNPDKGGYYGDKKGEVTYLKPETTDYQDYYVPDYAFRLVKDFLSL